MFETQSKAAGFFSLPQHQVCHNKAKQYSPNEILREFAESDTLRRERKNNVATWFGCGDDFIFTDYVKF